MLSKAAVDLSRKFRSELGPQAAFARRIGVTPQALSGYLSGKYKPDPDVMAKIEDESGTPMRDWVTPAEDSAEPTEDESET